ncbi:MAG: hypothetical protein M0P20_01465 [Methanocorpusculum sp.]|jgi:hypothetical protein|nr:hypothetical protein [Methanocorpusculum sp.]MDD2470287.1 hypothetical protein [Methanocorpusculum sp.]
MTDQKKAVFFSTDLHDNLPHAFEDLRRIHGDFVEMIHVIEEASDASADADHKQELRRYADGFLGAADDLEKWMTTYADAVNAQLADNHLVYERDSYQTLNRILQWDKADIRQLARWISDLKELTAHIGLTMPYLLHVRQIPTEAIPADIAAYPAFVMDRQGYCLCGMGLDEILYVDEVREKMAEKKLKR